LKFTGLDSKLEIWFCRYAPGFCTRNPRKIENFAMWPMGNGYGGEGHGWPDFGGVGWGGGRGASGGEGQEGRGLPVGGVGWARGWPEEAGRGSRGCGGGTARLQRAPVSFVEGGWARELWGGEGELLVGSFRVEGGQEEGASVEVWVVVLMVGWLV
jgi:hypothetical protein